MSTTARRALLSRLGSPDCSPVGEVPSIVAHLGRLLNTRQGDAPCAPGYGVIDFADMVHAFPASAQQLARSIRATIQEYEPRLRNVSVRQVTDDDGLILHFEITAQLAQAKSARTLHLETRVRPGGRIDVSG